MKIASTWILLLLLTHAFGQGKINYLTDGFDDNHNNWSLGVSPEYGFRIEDGHMLIDANQVSVHIYKNVGATKSDPIGVHARMIFFNGTSEGWMGVRLAMSEDAKSYITFSYNNATGFLISVNTGKKYEVLRQSKSSVVKPYDYNTLTVVKGEDTYKFLINDKQVHEEKIKAFFGPQAGLYVSQNMSIRVDEFQVFDVKRGRQRIAASQAVMAKTTEKDVKDIILNETTMPEDFAQFYKSFEKYVFPYEYSTVITRAKTITDLPFVQKEFFEYDLSTTRNHNVFAIALLSVCQNGYTFLVANQSTTDQQEVTNYKVFAYDNQGKKLGAKSVGSFVKENGSMYQTMTFRISQASSAIMIHVEETYFNGNVRKSLVSFNGDLCNLNSSY